MQTEQAICKFRNGGIGEQNKEMRRIRVEMQEMRIECGCEESEWECRESGWKFKKCEESEWRPGNQSGNLSISVEMTWNSNWKR